MDQRKYIIQNMMLIITHNQPICLMFVYICKMHLFNICYAGVKSFPTYFQQNLLSQKA